MNVAHFQRLLRLSASVASRLSRGCSNLDSTSSACKISVKVQTTTQIGACRHGRSFSSKLVSADEDNLRNNPEVRAWMEQLSQHFAEAEKVHPSQRDESGIQSSAADADHIDTGHLLSEDTTHFEIESYGYLEEEEKPDEKVQERHVPISLERGKAGVFDVEELVTVLEDQNGVDIQVINIPPEACFVDHMVIVSGKSLRHMLAMSSTIQWLYNRKRRRGDKPFRLEGKDCCDWLAMDLGNVAVHIFTPATRRHYDLETLWTLGPAHDDERHYVQDEHVNLSAAELFWLETGMNQVDRTIVEHNVVEQKHNSAGSDSVNVSNRELEGSTVHAKPHSSGGRSEKSS